MSEHVIDFDRDQKATCNCGWTGVGDEARLHLLDKMAREVPDA